MHSAIVGGCFLLLILVPCFVAVYSASKEGRTGNTGTHAIASAPVPKGERPSRIRMAADAAFGKDEVEAAPTAQRPSRLQRVATALIYRESPKYVPMRAGDPGTRQQSIRELRAKHAAAAKSARS